jgi:putative endonuclease
MDSYYIGSCEDLDKRMNDHLNSKSKFTKKAKDWELKYFETFNTRSEAMKREYEIKRKKSRKYIVYLISLGSENSI